MKASVITHIVALAVGLGLGVLFAGGFKKGDQGAKEAGNALSESPSGSQRSKTSAGARMASASDPKKRSGGARIDKSIDALLDSTDSPISKEAELGTLGLRAAAAGIEEALQALAALEIREEKVPYLRGVFAHIARAEPPGSALEWVLSLEDSLHKEGYRALVSEWTGFSLSSSRSVDDLASVLMRTEKVSDEVKDAWLGAFADHPARSKMLAERATNLVRKDLAGALALGADLRGWEHKRFVEQLAVLWAVHDSKGAWQWLDSNQAQATPRAVANVLGVMYQQNPDAALAEFARLEGAERRVAAAATLARWQAARSGTQAGVDWADSLPNQAERDAAHERIYQETPRGIGAMLDKDEGGALSVRGFLPDTPAADAGLREGDRIVEVDSGDGRFQMVSGTNLQEAVGLIRGEPGSPLRLRVLRPNGRDGFDEHVIGLKRQQLFFPAQKEDPPPLNPEPTPE